MIRDATLMNLEEYMVMNLLLVLKKGLNTLH